MTLSVNLLYSLESVSTDRELATYIKVALLHFTYNLNVFSDGQMLLFVFH